MGREGAARGGDAKGRGGANPVRDSTAGAMQYFMFAELGVFSWHIYCSEIC